jgi:phage FluMu gp28-like protein
LGYLEVLARQWQSARPPLLIVPKARRMRLTWAFTALHVWLAWSRPRANVFFVSSKEEKSAELIERARGIVSRLPPERVGKVEIRQRASPPQIQFMTTGSKIIGVPEGADQLRQMTATAIFADEFGTWEWPRAAFAAMRPTIDGGGRLTILSSAYPGFFRELCAGEALGG